MRTSEHRTTLTVGRVTVTVVDRTEIRSYQRDDGLFIIAQRRPYAVLLEEKEGEGTSRRRIPLAD